MKEYEVTISYTYIVEAEHQGEAESIALGMYANYTPRTDEVNVLTCICGGETK